MNYFQFTLNSYAKDIEKGIRPKREIVNTFIKLSKKIGKEKVIWRYDPILLNKKYTKEFIDKLRQDYQDNSNYSALSRKYNISEIWYYNNGLIKQIRYIRTGYSAFYEYDKNRKLVHTSDIK